MIKKTLMAFAGLALAAFAATPADARVRAGMLTCTVAPGVGLVLGSQKQVNCDFSSVQGWHESYWGRITRIGLDVGFTEGGSIAWAVYAPAEGGRGALAGNYGGATGEATIGGGLGANEIGIFLGTAHPAKFAEIVEPVIGRTVPMPGPLAEALARPRNLLKIEASPDAVLEAIGV